MKTSTLSLQIYLHWSTSVTNSTAKSPFLIPIKTTPYLKLKYSIPHASTSCVPSRTTTIPRRTLGTKTSQIDTPRCQKPSKREFPQIPSNVFSRYVILSAVSIGFVLFLMGLDDQKALAFGPEGPLVEEFWDNVRRYALYALTVSSGAIYTILLPIYELLKNPISAILLLVILGGGLYIVSQVLSAMVGVTDFSYDYGY